MFNSAVTYPETLLQDAFAKASLPKGQSLFALPEGTEFTFQPDDRFSPITGTLAAHHGSYDQLGPKRFVASTLTRNPMEKMSCIFFRHGTWYAHFIQDGEGKSGHLVIK